MDAMKETNKQIGLLNEREQKRYRYELSKLDEAQQQQLEALVVRMVRSGAKKPLNWAWSEFREGIPQWARFMVISGMYRSAHAVESNADEAAEFDTLAAETYLELLSVMDKDKLHRFLKAYAKGMLYNMLGIFDEGNFDYEAKDSWMLVEYDRDKAAVGKPVSALHEDFLEFESEIDPEADEH